MTCGISDQASAAFPKGVTLQKVESKAPTMELQIAVDGGVYDHINTRDDSLLIHFFLTGRRPVGCSMNDWRAVAQAAIERLEAVAAQLRKMLEE